MNNIEENEQVEAVITKNSSTKIKNKETSKPASAKLRKRTFKKDFSNNAEKKTSSSRTRKKEISKEVSKDKNEDTREISCSQEEKINATKEKNEEINKEPFIVSLEELSTMKSNELKKLCSDLSLRISNSNNHLKQNIIFLILKKYNELYGSRLIIKFLGVVELHNNDTFGFVRNPHNDYKASPSDIYINYSSIKKYGLKTGDTIEGEARYPKVKDKHFLISKVIKINLFPIELNPNVIVLENEITEHPNTRILFEKNKDDYCGRMIDLISPMGLGQRAIISAAPRTGKTALMKSMALSIRQNYPSIKLLVLLIDERPEEVTDMKQSIQGAEVIASTFDEDPETQIHLAEIAYHKARRLAEYGHDVFMFIDSIGRLARNFNQVQTNSGRSLSGGIDANALYKTKKFVGLARNIKGSGSISVVGSCLINTNSKLDDVVHEEFKGRGNCDISLSSLLSNRRLFPAFDIEKSGTRKEEALLHKDELAKHIQLRRELANYGSIEQTSILLNRIKDTSNNLELLIGMK